MAKKINALILGDVFGKPGCRALFAGLKEIIREYKADVVVVNGENAADGFGITPEIAEQFSTAGVDVITSGNHIWQKREIYPTLESRQNLLRPANYAGKVPGSGFCIIEKKGSRIGVINLQGRIRLMNIDCPFKAAKDIINKQMKNTDAVIIDFHAEEPEEKEALALYLDGKVSAVVGTHTHVQSADEKILKGGTAYITDIGVTGPGMSVIGSTKEISIQRSLTQMPLKLEVADNPAVLMGVSVSIDASTGKAISIERVRKEFAF